MDFLNPDSKKRAAIRAAFDKEFGAEQEVQIKKLNQVVAKCKK